MSGTIASEASLRGHHAAHAAFAVRCFGCIVGVAVTDETLLNDLMARIPAGATLVSSDTTDAIIQIRRVRGGPGYMCCDAVADKHAETLDELLDAFEDSLRFNIACHSRDFIFVHGGSVGWKDLAIALPGRSRTGKTTLVKALLAEGAEYFSDEHVILDPEGFVHPWSKSLALRAPGTVRQRPVAPEALNARIALSPRRLGLVLRSAFRPHARWSPQRMPASQTALALVTNAYAARLAPGDVMDVVSFIARHTPAFQSARPEAEHVASAILTLSERLHADGN